MGRAAVSEPWNRAAFPGPNAKPPVALGLPPLGRFLARGCASGVSDAEWPPGFARRPPAAELVDQNRCGEAPPPGVDGLPRTGTRSAPRADIDGQFCLESDLVDRWSSNRPGLPASPLGRGMSDSARSFPFLLFYFFKLNFSGTQSQIVHGCFSL